MSDQKEREELLKTFEKWSEKIKQQIIKRPERKEAFVNTSGIPINRLYTCLDQRDIDYLSESGFPEYISPDPTLDPI